MRAQGSHRIIAFGTDLMRLLDARNGTQLLEATRQSGVWTVTTDDSEHVGDFPSRQDAIRAMIDKAVELNSGVGVSCTVPHGLLDEP